jgi:hypothetical protein
MKIKMMFIVGLLLINSMETTAMQQPPQEKMSYYAQLMAFLRGKKSEPILAAEQVAPIVVAKPTGSQLLSKYRETAIKKQPIGLVKSAKTGAQVGAIAGFLGGMGAIGMLEQLYGMKTGRATPTRDVGVEGGQITLGTGMAVGATAGAVAMMVKDSLSNSSPEWVAQLKELENQISDNFIYIGVPTDQRTPELANKYGKIYLLSKYANTITNAFLDGRREMYLMPKDEYLGDVFVELNRMFEREELGAEIVEFMAIRPTPGVTKSLWNSKILPRIIIGFVPSSATLNLNKDKLQKMFIGGIMDALVKKFPDAGLGIQPRYSEKINDLIYLAYGSGDFKDSRKGQLVYPPVEKRTLRMRLFGPRDEDMAYRRPDQRIDLK